MIIFRVLKKLENKTRPLIDLATLEPWNKLLSALLPKLKKELQFDFQDLDSKPVNGKDGNLLLLGNSTIKMKMGSKIDSFTGDIVRFNRFQIIHEDYLGSKTTKWFISNNIVFDERRYAYQNLEDVKKRHPGIQAFLVTTINTPEELIEKQDKIPHSQMIEVMDTRAIIPILKNLTIQYIQQIEKWSITNQHFLQKNGYIKPSTGLLAIMYGIMNYKKIFIHNFDFFRSNHYWIDKLNYGEIDRDGKWYKGIDGDKVIGHHEFLFEEAVINQIVSKGLVKWLK